MATNEYNENDSQQTATMPPAGKGQNPTQPASAPSPESAYDIDDSVDPILDVDPRLVPADPQAELGTKKPPEQRPPAQPSSQKAYRHPDWMLEQAELFGIPAEQAARTPAHDLGRLIAHLNRQNILGQQRETAQHVIDQRGNNGAPRQQPQQEQTAEPPQEEEVEGWDFTDEELDPSWQKKFKTPLLAQKKYIKQLEDRLAKIEGREQVRQQNETDQMVDRAFASLPEEQRTLFGEGSGVEMDRQSAEFQRRMTVFNEVKRRIQAGERGDFKHHFKSVVDFLTSFGSQPGAPSGESVYEEEQESPQEEEFIESPPQKTNGNGRPQVVKRQRQQYLTPEQRLWNASGVAKPSQRKAGQEPKGRSRAEKKLHEGLKAMGNVTEDEEIMEGFLE